MNKILKLLNENPRLTNDQLAAMLGLDEKEVARAIAEYESEGVIGGYRAIVDWDKVDDCDKVTAMIELRVTPQRDNGFDGIAEEICAFPEVESVYLMSGGYDFNVCVTGRNFQEIALFVASRISTLDCVQSTTTHFLLKRYKDSGIMLSESEDDERGNYTL